MLWTIQGLRMGAGIHYSFVNLIRQSHSLDIHQSLLSRARFWYRSLLQVVSFIRVVCEIPLSASFISTYHFLSRLNYFWYSALSLIYHLHFLDIFSANYLGLFLGFISESLFSRSFSIILICQSHVSAHFWYSVFGLISHLLESHFWPWFLGVVLMLISGSHFSVSSQSLDRICLVDNGSNYYWAPTAVVRTHCCSCTRIPRRLLTSTCSSQSFLTFHRNTVYTVWKCAARSLFKCRFSALFVSSSQQRSLVGTQQCTDAHPSILHTCSECTGSIESAFFGTGSARSMKVLTEKMLPLLGEKPQNRIPKLLRILAAWWTVLTAKVQPTLTVFFSAEPGSIPRVEP